MRRYWYNLSIRNKLMGFLLFVILSLSAFSLYLLAAMYGFLGSFNGHVTEYFQVNVLQQHNEKNDRLISQYFDDFRLDSLAEFNQSMDAFHGALSEIQAKPHSLESYLVLRSIHNSFISYSDEINTAIKKQRSGSRAFQIHYYNAARINRYMERYLTQLLELSLQEGNTVYRELAADARTMVYFSAVLIGFFVLSCLIFGIVFSNHLTKPIEQLAAVSQQMSTGNLQVGAIVVLSNDEVGTLAKSFNVMSANIRKLVGDLQEKSLIEKRLHAEELKNSRNKELLKEARFLALQSQINPHFLFNTLNTISRVITFSRLPEAIGLINALAKILRYNMGSSKAYVTLQDELEIVRQYAFIQQFRFGDRLKIDIRCSAELDATQVTIPCFTLQPLVENAVIHGIEPRVSGGMVRIRSYPMSGGVVIKVVDNGNGMNREKVKTILSMRSRENTGHTSAIGLRNVMNRLTIFCGKKTCFSIKSKLGLGTVVSLKLPSTGVR